MGRAGYSTNTYRQQEIQKSATGKFTFSSLLLQRRNSQDKFGLLNVTNMYKTVFLVQIISVRTRTTGERAVEQLFCPSQLSEGGGAE